MPDRVATAVWTISPALVLALDAQLGTPVDSYLNGSQTWLLDNGPNGTTLEWRLHPVSGYRTPQGVSHYDVLETAVQALAQGGDPHAIAFGSDVRPLTGLWDGLECYAAYGDEFEPANLGAAATEAIGIAPDAVGLVDHEAIADAWERAQGNVSIVAVLLEELRKL